MMTNPCLYLLCRNDLDSMNHGKAICHGAHASNQFLKHMDPVSVPVSSSPKSIYKAFKAKQRAYLKWIESADGFGATISLSLTLPEMEMVIINAENLGLQAALTTDPTYPYVLHREYADLIKHEVEPIDIGNNLMKCVREEITCGYIFGDKEDLIPILGKFPLV